MLELFCEAMLVCELLVNGASLTCDRERLPLFTLRVMHFLRFGLRHHLFLLLAFDNLLYCKS